MARYYIVNLEDGEVTRTDSLMQADPYEGDDRYVLIDSRREVVMFEGEAVSIPEEEDEPEEDGPPEEEELPEQGD